MNTLVKEAGRGQVYRPNQVTPLTTSGTSVLGVHIMAAVDIKTTAPCNDKAPQPGISLPSKSNPEVFAQYLL